MLDQPRPRIDEPSPRGDGALIEVRALERSFGPRRAVAGIDFTLDSGECLALFGPNGAGKTTVLRILAGLLTPTRGHAAIAGVTGHGPLFVLEHLAWDHGMKVLVREEHPRGPESGDAEPLFSWLIGPGSGLSKVSPRG